MTHHTNRDVVRLLVKITKEGPDAAERLQWLRERIDRDEGDWRDVAFTLHGRDIWREELDAAIEEGDPLRGKK